MAYLSYIWDDEKQQYINIGGSDYTKIYYDTTEGWNAKRELIAQNNTLYIYTDGSSYTDGEGTVRNLPAMKLGDGTTYLIDLPLVTTNEQTIQSLTAHVNNQTVHITDEERIKWNGKCRVDESKASSGILVLTND